MTVQPSLEQRRSDVGADALAGAGDDGGSCLPSLRAQWRSNPAAQGWIASLALAMTAERMPESRPPIDLQGISLAELQR